MVSVAIPAMKVRFLREAITSVLKQTFPNFELIIVNDASGDDIKSVVDGFKDDRIRYYANEHNLGIIGNWNRCLELAKGEYFVLFSDDDLYAEGFLEEMNSLAMKYPRVDLFHCRTNIIDERGEPVNYSASCPEYESAVDFVWHRLKRYRMQFAPDFMCRTEALRTNGGFVNFPHAWGSDDATWFSLANPEGVAASAKTLCSWRQSGINTAKIADLRSRLGAANQHMNWLRAFIEERLVVAEEGRMVFRLLESALMEADLFVKAELLVLNAGDSYLGIFKPMWLYLECRNLHEVRFASLLICYAKLFRNLLKKKSKYELDELSQ